MQTERQVKLHNASKKISEVIFTSGLSTIEVIGLLETIKNSFIEMATERDSKGEVSLSVTVDEKGKTDVVF